jgi:hypothetical protein
MFSKPRSLLLAASLMSVPVAAAMAQAINPSGNAGSNRSDTATPGTADSKANFGMNTSDMNAPTGLRNTENSPMKPGSTGQTIVPGSNSTRAGDASGTAEQKTGQTSGGR